MKFSLKHTTQTTASERKSVYVNGIVSKFETIIRDEINLLPANERNEAIKALHLAMIKVNSVQFIGYETDDFMTLRKLYNNVVFSSAEIAYVAR